MKALFAAVALAALPVTANAVTVPVTDFGGFYYGSGSVTTSTDTTFMFTIPVALEDATVELSGTGLLQGTTLSYSLDGAAPVAITTPFAASFAVGMFAPGTYTVSYDFGSSAMIPISLTATLYGTPVPVPVPAAGAMAAAGIIAFGALKSRRKTG